MKNWCFFLRVFDSVGGGMGIVRSLAGYLVIVTP